MTVSAAAPGRLTLETADGLAWIVIDNPARLNACTRDPSGTGADRSEAAAPDRPA